MKYGLFVYEESHNNLINIGDYVQSLAARQFLPQVDTLVERDQLHTITDENLKIIMNGWFTHRPQNWPPSDNIIPLFVSFHLNKRVAERMLSNIEIVDYFKRNAPIGCRDYDSVRKMKEAGIDCYYSGCLTTTLNHDGKLIGKSPEKSNKILLVDVLFKDDVRLRFKRNKLYIIRDILNGKILELNKVSKFINALVPKTNKSEVEVETCYYSKFTSEEQRFDHALNILKKLAKAKIVVTSRIHIALPCLALGTPVLFVFGGKLTDLQEFRRLDGIINLMNVLVEDDFDTSAEHLKNIKFLRRDDIDWDNPPENPRQHIEIRNELIRKCQSFV